MDSFIEQFVVYVGLFIFVSIIALVVRHFYNKAQKHDILKNYPDYPHVHLIKQEIRSLKNAGEVFQSLIDIIRIKYKLSKNIVRGLIIETENESLANINDCKTAVKDKYTFRYPGNWKINPIDNSLDPDLFFSVEGSYSGIIGFSFIGHVSEKIPDFSEVLLPIKDQYKNFTETSKIEQWGSFKGEGISFTCVGLGNLCKGIVFLYRKEKNSFCISQLTAEDDSINTAEGFKLVENTFKLNNLSEK